MNCRGQNAGKSQLRFEIGVRTTQLPLLYRLLSSPIKELYFYYKNIKHVNDYYEDYVDNEFTTVYLQL
jgi:hypothetical protein